MRQLTLSEADDPRITAPSQAVVRPFAVSTCDFDHFVAGGAFGSIGLYAVAIAKAVGAGAVDYVDAHAVAP